MPSTLPQRVPAVAGIATLALLLLITLLLPETARGVLRDSAYDIVLDADQRIWVARQAELPVIVVDIDRPSIEAFGPWPWPRETIARLVEAVAARRQARPRRRHSMGFSPRLTTARRRRSRGGSAPLPTVPKSAHWRRSCRTATSSSRMLSKARPSLSASCSIPTSIARCSARRS